MALGLPAVRNVLLDTREKKMEALVRVGFRKVARFSG